MDRKQKVNGKSSGFVDTDLATDNHDLVMIWLSENIEDVLQNMGQELEKYQWEFPIVKGDGRYKSIVGYIDLLSWVKGYGNIAFEVKSQIKNVGEVIRQIRQYQVFAPTSCKFVIVCPDDKFQKIIESQGIGFLRCPVFDDHNKVMKDIEEQNKHIF